MVFSISAKQAAAILALFAVTVHSHVVMIEPPPFEYPDPQNKQAPLDPTGSDFPCKFKPGFTPHAQAPAELKPGKDANTLSLQGGATHGGGSCQISLTSDLLPTKNSKWEVIKSIEGGCPSEAENNLSESALTELPPISYTVPDGMAAGKYTLAWTWFNKKGNREMYMNCAPVQFGGAAAKREAPKISKKRQSTLPAMFTANIGNGCGTVENYNIVFPDPGQAVAKAGGSSSKNPDDKPGLHGSCDAAGAQPAGTSSGGAAPATGADAPAKSAPATGADAPAKSAPANDAPTTAPSSAAPATDNAAPSTNGAAPPAAAGDSPASGGACAQEGMFVCAPDGSSFTRCASGVMSVPIKMSPGVKCTPGQDANLKIAASKRAVRFGAEHVARSGEAAY